MDAGSSIYSGERTGSTLDSASKAGSILDSDTEIRGSGTTDGAGVSAYVPSFCKESSVPEYIGSESVRKGEK